MTEVAGAPKTSANRWLDSEKLLEATMELGRNWMIAVVVASFAAAYWYQEIALESWMTRDVVLRVGVIFSLVWMGLAIVRFMLVARFEDKTKLQTALSLMVIAVLVFVGLGLIIAVAKTADNANAVRVCSAYADAHEHMLHNHPVCQRLYEDREGRTKGYVGD